MKLFKGQKGLSLVEVTIMLLVLMLLTGVLAPSIMDYVKDAQWVKVKEDCEAISLSIARLMRDVPCVVTDATTPGGCNYAVITPGGKIPSVLYSDGPAQVSLGPLAINASPSFGGSWNWTDALAGPNYADSFENQLVTNNPAYLQPPNAQASPFGPFFNKGWRGAYLSAPIGPDPWGSMYLVNSLFLNVPKGTALNPGLAHNYDAFCISAGPNRVYETPFMQLGATHKGDDFITVISGGTF